MATLRFTATGGNYSFILPSSYPSFNIYGSGYYVTATTKNTNSYPSYLGSISTTVLFYNSNTSFTFPSGSYLNFSVTDGTNTANFRASLNGKVSNTSMREETLTASYYSGTNIFKAGATLTATISITGLPNIVSYTRLGIRAYTSADNTLYTTVSSTNKTYTITYNSGDYSSESNQTQTKYHGTNVTLKGAIYSRTGYVQTGWSTSSNGSSKNYNLSATFSSNSAITLYPYWEISSYYLKLNGYLNGAEVESLEGFGRADIYINNSLFKSNIQDFNELLPYGTSYEFKNISALKGYKYDGIHSGSLSGTITNTASTTILSFSYNSYIIEYNLNGGESESIPTIEYTYNPSGTLTLSTEIPVKEGYNFRCWSTTSDKVSNITYQPGDQFPLNFAENVILYAVWDQDSYDLIINPNGGEINGSTSKITISGELKYNESNLSNLKDYIPERLGYEFLGYFDAIQNGVQVYNNLGEAILNNKYWNKDGKYIYTDNLILFALYGNKSLVNIAFDNIWEKANIYLYKNGKWHQVLQKQYNKRKWQDLI